MEVPTEGKTPSFKIIYGGKYFPVTSNKKIARILFSAEKKICCDNFLERYINSTLQEKYLLQLSGSAIITIHILN